MSDNSEKISSPEIEIGPSEAAAERHEQLVNESERPVEKPRDAEKSAEKARFDALETAVSVESGSAEKKRQNDNVSSKKRGVISKRDKEISFKKQMRDIQATQNPIERTFSRIIHNKVVEKTSDVVGSTVARPDAILSGAIFAFILSLIVYVTAKNIGYQLSGFETIGSFVLGWLIGLVYDYLKVVITGKK